VRKGRLRQRCTIGGYIACQLNTRPGREAGPTIEREGPMARELGPIHDDVQSAALETLMGELGVETYLAALYATSYGDFLQACYTAAINRIAELEEALREPHDSATPYISVIELDHNFDGEDWRERTVAMLLKEDE
jgi:hypothetical protein